MRRNLDGIYFRVKREDGYDNVCFTDLTVEEREEVLQDRTEEWLKTLCMHLAERLKYIGDEIGIVNVD